LSDIDPTVPVAQLGVGQQQLVEIAQALSHDCRLLILDEPTAPLTDPEIDLLFKHIERLKREGVGIIYISHRLAEIRRIADRVTVLRDGRVVDTRPVEQITLDEIVQLMTGRDAVAQIDTGTRQIGGVAMRVEGLCRGNTVRNVSFEVRRGEILGFAGLVGSGRTETMRAIFGADQPDAGQVMLGESNTPVRTHQPRDAVRAGIGLVPEDRKVDGLLLPQSVRTNITLARLRDVMGPKGWINPELERTAAETMRRSLDVRSTSVEQPVEELSGGNQQKVVIARWLMRDCDVLLFDEPTRGIDVGTKWTVYELLGELAGRGKAIVVVSSDLPELMSICDRIAVMSAGELVATFERGQWTQEGIMAAAISGYIEPAGVQEMN
jgi:ribose transport system ATP-binding protein